ncbi:MAG: hypothetical protein LBS84_00740 [Clostridiales bacterium]|nr:hypothetical protein [Clostridiales bacterium]
MKKLLILLTVLVYSVPASLFLSFTSITARGSDDSASLGALLIPIICMLFTCALVIVNIMAAAYSAARARCLSFRVVMVFKLCLIPFYILNFLCWGLASIVFHIAIVVWPLIPFVVAYTYFTTLATSAHIIAKLADLRRNKSITTKQLVGHSVWQLIFVADTIDSIYLAKKQKKFE